MEIMYFAPQRSIVFSRTPQPYYISLLEITNTRIDICLHITPNKHRKTRRQIKENPPDGYKKTTRRIEAAVMDKLLPDWRQQGKELLCYGWLSISSSNL
jgi:hypothetical protein